MTKRMVDNQHDDAGDDDGDRYLKVEGGTGNKTSEGGRDEGRFSAPRPLTRRREDDDDTVKEPRERRRRVIHVRKEVGRPGWHEEVAQPERGRGGEDEPLFPRPFDVAEDFDSGGEDRGEEELRGTGFSTTQEQGQDQGRG